MADLNSEGRYDDLLYTKFPADVDSWEDVTDVTADTVALANQYRDYCVAGNYAAAQKLLDEDETGALKKMQINAMTINQMSHAIMAMERMFKTDVETYVKDQVFADDLMIWTYTHSYDANTHIHNFVGKGSNGKAKCTSNFTSGDKIAINGVQIPGYAGNDPIETAGVDIIISGRWVTFTYDGTQVNFKSGGGVSASKLAQATAIGKYVLEGQIYLAGDKELKSGEMPDRGGTNIEYAGSNKAIQEGYYNGSGVVSVAGGNQGGKNYTFSGSTLTIDKGWYNGTGKVYCQGGNQGSFIRTIEPGGSVTIPQGYHNGGGYIRANTNGVKNIKTAYVQSSNHNSTYPSIINISSHGYSYTIPTGTLIGVTGFKLHSNSIETTLGWGFNFVSISGNTISICTGADSSVEVYYAYYE